MEKVLVAFASKYGATAEIADRIGEVLRQANLPVEVHPADQVSDLAPYGAVVLGSAVYIGRWRKQAVKFLETHEAGLAQKPVWFFSSGPTGEGDPVELTQGWRFPAGQQAIADRIQPRDVAIFSRRRGSKEAQLPGQVDPQERQSADGGFSRLGRHRSLGKVHCRSVAGGTTGRVEICVGDRPALKPFSGRLTAAAAGIYSIPWGKQDVRL